MSRVSRIYLAGGIQKFFDNKDMHSATSWRDEIADRYSNRDDVQIIDPTKLFIFSDNYSLGMERVIFEQELELVHNSTLLVAYFNDPQSLGAMSEITTAYLSGVPVIGVVDKPERFLELHTWQKIMCKYLVKWYELPEVINYAIKER